MKKTISVFFALLVIITLITTTASAAPAALLTQTPELGQLKVCKVARSGVREGQLFTFRVNGATYNVPAGPPDRGYCVLAGQYPVGSQVTIEEVIPSGYYVSRIEVKPDRTVSKNTAEGIVTVRIISGVIEAIFTNKVSGAPTPTHTPTSVTPRPTNTATSTPSCAPNCTPTATPIPMGRMQICKEAEGTGVTGYFTFRFETNRSRQVPVGACAGLISVKAGTLTITEMAQAGFSVADIYTIPADRLISKDLAGGSATIRIVEGTAASQTIVIFRNRSLTTGTFTPTSTSTSTATPTFTGTSTGSVTPTFTGTPTGSATPTFTATSTGSVTPTFTGTPTGSATPTLTGTSTGTVTSTFTPTATPTSTPTGTVCTPVVIFANFNSVPVGQSVEGLGTVAQYLNIDATNGLAVRVGPGTQPLAYLAPNVKPIRPNDPLYINGGLAADGGFSDQDAQAASRAHSYTFTFTGVSVSNFSLHMLDYGDWNYPETTDHLVTMTAYGANGQPIPNAGQVLSYTSDQDAEPHTSEYGDLYLTGDAVTAKPGQPGNWTWNVSGSGIAKVVLEFGVGYDPNIALDLLSFTTECLSCQSFTRANFNAIPEGLTVEGFGNVAPHLSINATNGNAVRVSPEIDPLVYLAPNVKPVTADPPFINAGLAAGGGFSDRVSQAAKQAHLYTFTFAPGFSATNFSLHMLDYGDWNFPETRDHRVTLTAYNASGQPVATQVLDYTSDAVAEPRTSEYGDLYLTGDAVTAKPGQPGNWTWHVSANGIVRVTLEFGAGHDPNIAFDVLTYNVVCQ